MFYLVMTSILAYLGWQIWVLLDARKHDVNLYGFCQLRREAIAYLHENAGELSRADYIAIRKLIRAINGIIKGYNHNRTVVFNFRLFRKYVLRVQRASNQFDDISTGNPEILKLIERFLSLTFGAFISYTPFLRSEFTIRIAYSLARLGFLLQLRSLMRLREDIAKSLEIFKEHEALVPDSSPIGRKRAA